ncbi:MAG: hypothetical protein F7C38_08010 [Desulfurococcales archaeon]|nr:hypothetical protein [Desulfurococcales archaeon]
METRKLLLGSVAAVTRSGYIIVEINNPNMRIKIGGRVEDGKGVEIGKIIDLIGNIEKPYAVIKPAKETSIPSKGDQVYMILQRRRKGGKRRKGGARSARRGEKTRGVHAGRYHSHSRRDKGMRKRR